MAAITLSNQDLVQPDKEVMSLSFVDEKFHAACARMKHDHQQGILTVAMDMDNSLGDHDNGWIPGNHSPDADQELGTIISRMNEQNDGRCVIVTGRPYQFVQSVLPNVGLFTATEQGCLVFDPRGQKMCAHTVVGIDAMKQAITDKVITQYPGARVEAFKNATMTVEFTSIENAVALAPQITQKIQSVVKEVDPNQLTQVLNIAKPGNCCVEILPNGVDKLNALRVLTSRQRKFKDSTWAYVGDNNTDMSIMSKIFERRGYGVWVGDQVPSEYKGRTNLIQLDGPRATRSLLRYMIAG